MPALGQLALARGAGAGLKPASCRLSVIAARSRLASADKSCVGVDQGELVGAEQVLNEEAPPSNNPQGHASAQSRQHLQFLAAAAEQVGQRRELRGRLGVTNDGLRVGQQSLGQAALLTASYPLAPRSDAR